MKVRYVFIALFFLLISISFTVSEIYKKRTLSNELDRSIKHLKTNYNLVLHDYKVAAESIKYSIFEFPEVKKILSSIAHTSKQKKSLLRKKLYDLLKKDFETYKKLGVKLILFTEPDNHVFLRMHKPDTYDDNISNIRLALASVNKKHKEMSGFEQGKISHAFRYIYPIFDQDNHYIGNIDISFSSERLQKTLDDVHKFHSHFLVRKDVIDSRMWSVKNLTSPYQLSIEHPDYTISKRQDKGHIDLENTKLILEKNKQYIDHNIQNSNEFAIYGEHDDDFMVVSFLPINSIMPHEHADAYLVSYTPNTNITRIEREFFMINSANVLIITLILLFIYLMVMKRKEIQKQHERYLKLMNLASDGIYIMDMSGKLLEFSEASAKMLGYSTDEMKNLSIYDWDVMFTKDEALALVRNIPTEPITFETLHKRKNGTVYDASITAVKITIDSQDYIYASTRDITDHKQKEQEIREKLQKFIDTQNSIVILTDGKKLKFANKMFFEFFGYKDLEAFLEHYNCICNRFIEEDPFFHLGKVKSDEAHWIESLLNLSGRQRIVSIEDVEKVPHAFSVSINKYDKNEYVVSFSDISDTMVEKFQLKQQATKDALTGVFNRVYFNQNIQHILHKHSKDDFNTGIIFLDIDFFKQINDTYGHDIGDEILKKVTLLVKRYIRNEDKLIRWGGEEFIIITSSESIDGVYKIAEHIRSVIEKYDFKPAEKVTCSFGCALHDNKVDILETIKIADNKLYLAKNRGRNRVES